MSTVVRFFLELLRSVLILWLGMVLLGAMERSLYGHFSISYDSYEWIAMAANFLLVFVLYRNVLQFKGWFCSPQNKTLPVPVTFTLLPLALLLLIIPFYPLVQQAFSSAG